MEILVKRKTKTDKSTIGELSLDGVFECFTLEDKDRGLSQKQPLAEIQSAKIKTKTAIPSGRYQVIMSMSNKYKKIMPEVVNVPGFQGIRIHSGNTDVDSEGCLLLGRTKGVDAVYESKLAVSSFEKKLTEALKTQKVYITIQ